MKLKRGKCKLCGCTYKGRTPNILTSISFTVCPKCFGNKRLEYTYEEIRKAPIAASGSFYLMSKDRVIQKLNEVHCCGFNTYIIV